MSNLARIDFSYESSVRSTAFYQAYISYLSSVTKRFYSKQNNNLTTNKALYSKQIR